MTVIPEATVECITALSAFSLSLSWLSNSSFFHALYLQVAHNLFTAELALSTELKVGMETYFQPLRSILPEQSHQKIFLAIPEVRRVEGLIFPATSSE